MLSRFIEVWPLTPSSTSGYPICRLPRNPTSNASIMPRIPHRTAPTYHPGSSVEDINQEPEWGEVPGHRVGFRDEQGRFSGLTHQPADFPLDEEFLKHAQEEYDRLKERAAKGELLTVVDFMKMQTVGISSLFFSSLA